MAKSRSFSVYLLKTDYDAQSALKDDHLLGENWMSGTGVHVTGVHGGSSQNIGCGLRLREPLLDSLRCLVVDEFLN